ncbi:MAG: hypothetical protein KDC07_06515 [Chitinophagaceae bacterium]|nr:hypothetical protein [Chitinophagaceae bacterium]MCB9045455.1 hypothetical protein [Chitinophagales bacterium]
MIKKSLPFLLLAFAFTVATFSCKKPDDRPAPPQAEQEYYPLEIGKWVVYDVDSTIWDDTFCVKRFYHYQVRHRVADTFTDESGRPSYRVETSIRKRVEDDWMPHKVFYATNTNVTLETVHDQQRFINMVFPIENGVTWKGNNYILTNDPDYAFYGDWDYEYKNVGEAYNTGFEIFANTVTVEEVDRAESDPEVFPDVYASRTSSREVYASGVGMVFREYFRWTYDPSTTKCRKGSGVVMRAVDHN